MTALAVRESNLTPSFWKVVCVHATVREAPGVKAVPCVVDATCSGRTMLSARLQTREVVDHGVRRPLDVEPVEVWLHAVVFQQLPKHEAIGKVLRCVRGSVHA